MRLNLRRVREIQELKLKEVADKCHISVERLRAIEQYQELPEFYEVIRILKCTKHYFDEVCAIVWHDIEDHYKPNDYSEYKTIKSSLKIGSLPTEELERRFTDEK